MFHISFVFLKHSSQQILLPPQIKPFDLHNASPLIDMQKSRVPMSKV